jgi:hypothetical protein
MYPVIFKIITYPANIKSELQKYLEVPRLPYHEGSSTGKIFTIIF